MNDFHVRENTGVNIFPNTAGAAPLNGYWHQPNVCPGCGRCKDCGRQIETQPFRPWLYISDRPWVAPLTVGGGVVLLTVGAGNAAAGANPLNVLIFNHTVANN